MNIAKVLGETSPGLLKRFEIRVFPTLLYFRLGSFYNITGPRDGKYLYDMILEQKYLDYDKKTVSDVPSFFDQASIKNFFALPFLVHCIWILSLVAIIAFVMPNKIKTS